MRQKAIQDNCRVPSTFDTSFFVGHVERVMAASQEFEVGDLDLLLEEARLEEEVQSQMVRDIRLSVSSILRESSVKDEDFAFYPDRKIVGAIRDMLSLMEEFESDLYVVPERFNNFMILPLIRGLENGVLCKK